MGTARRCSLQIVCASRRPLCSSINIYEFRVALHAPLPPGTIQYASGPGHELNILLPPLVPRPSNVGFGWMELSQHRLLDLLFWFAVSVYPRSQIRKPLSPVLLRRYDRLLSVYDAVYGAIRCRPSGSRANFLLACWLAYSHAVFARSATRFGLCLYDFCLGSDQASYKRPFSLL